MSQSPEDGASPRATPSWLHAVQTGLLPGTRVVVLGASGWIGLRLVRALLVHAKCQVECWVRKDGSAERLLGLPGSQGRVTVRCNGSLAELSVPSDTLAVVHGASPTNHWDVSGSIDANVGVTWRLLDDLSNRPEPPRLIFLSTLLIRGDGEEPFLESDLDVGQSFLTPYAQAKFLGETAIRSTYARDVHTAILRLGSVLWPRSRKELPCRNWLCQSVQLWRRGCLQLIPLPEDHRFYPVAVDDLCAFIMHAIASDGVPRTLHLPAESGPTIGSVFATLARESGTPEPRFCASDSDEWIDFIDSMPSSAMRRRLAAMFPVPPKGARLSGVSSELSRTWIAGSGLDPHPLTGAYWMHLLTMPD